jgi:hypothetical protein
VIRDVDEHWCEVEIEEKRGFFPKNKLRRANEEEEKEEEMEKEDEECYSNKGGRERRGIRKRGRGRGRGEGGRGRGRGEGGRGVWMNKKIEITPSFDVAKREREKINANPDAKFSDNELIVKNIPATCSTERV